MKYLTMMTVLCIGLVVQSPVKAEEDHDHDETSSSDDMHGHAEERSTQIDDTMAAEVGIGTAFAASQVIHQSVVVYGNLAAGPEQISHVRARFTGVIKSVKATMGDKVKRGDLLTEVESNDALKTYPIRAPISGIVLQRHANTGEVTQDQVLFSIADFHTLWAELRIYPSQQIRVRPDQTVRIKVNEKLLEGSIRHVIPVLDKPYLLARVELDNASNTLTPGLLVEGHIEVSEFAVEVAVYRDAVQVIDGKQGVFVKDGDEYHFAPVQPGRNDEHYVEVLSGLSQGQEYVSRNSYLIKADIEKSEAEHDD